MFITGTKKKVKWHIVSGGPNDLPSALALAQEQGAMNTKNDEGENYVKKIEVPPQETRQLRIYIFSNARVSTTGFPKERN